MEDKVNWHGVAPSEAQAEQAREELDAARELLLIQAESMNENTGAGARVNTATNEDAAREDGEEIENV